MGRTLELAGSNVYRQRLVVRTKLTPTWLHKRVLDRPRLTHRLLEAMDYRLTIVQAGGGRPDRKPISKEAQDPEQVRNANESRRRQ
jgi:hypothetical protein